MLVFIFVFLKKKRLICRFYQLSCLLIEFSPDKSFCLQSAKDISDEIQINNVCSKLSLLVIAFPKLRILWSRSPHVTADIFKTLKAGRLDADPDQATAIGNKSYLGTDDEARDYAGGDSSVEAEVCPLIYVYFHDISISFLIFIGCLRCCA
jgi:ERCC4-type nuclease